MMHKSVGVFCSILLEYIVCILLFFDIFYIQWVVCDQVIWKVEVAFLSR